jgi:hypothetical protein
MMQGRFSSDQPGSRLMLEGVSEKGLVSTRCGLERESETRVMQRRLRKKEMERPREKLEVPEVNSPRWVARQTFPPLTLEAAAQALLLAAEPGWNS